MAMNPRIPGKSRPVSKPAPISIKEELEPISIKEELEGEELLVAEPVAVEFAAAPPVEIESVAAEPVPAPVVERIVEPAVVEAAAVAVSVVAPASLEARAAASAPELDPGEWSLKTFDLFNENAAAVLDLALALGQAQSVSDAIELQSRFASERYSTLVRQTNEFVELTRRLAFDASAPVRLSISAFVA